VTDVELAEAEEDAVRAVVAELDALVGHAVGVGVAQADHLALGAVFPRLVLAGHVDVAVAGHDDVAGALDVLGEQAGAETLGQGRRRRRRRRSTADRRRRRRPVRRRLHMPAGMESRARTCSAANAGE
jgi:hypothetical protein